MKFTKTHEWIETDGTTASVGITDYAQKAMGDIVYVELPSVGDEAKAGESICELESVKAVAPVNCPASGTVCVVNDELDNDPAAVNRDAYGAWLYKIENAVIPDDLMTEEEYKAYIKTL